MSLTEIPRPTTERPSPGAILRVTVLGVVSPLADGDVLRDLIQRVGAQVDELAPRGDVARRFDVQCTDDRQRIQIRERLADGDEYGHVLVEDLTGPARVERPSHPLAEELSWSHLPGTLRTQLQETARKVS